MGIDLWFFVGATIGGGAFCVVMFMIGFVADVYASWQHGRELALFVTEQNHQRRVELLTTMIELERARHAVASTDPLIASQERAVSELAICRRDDAPTGEGNAGHRAALPRP